MLDRFSLERLQKEPPSPSPRATALIKDKKMQATSSQVTTVGTTDTSIFMASAIDEEPGGIIPLELKKAASDSGRDHLLVRRRRRDTRRGTR